MALDVEFWVAADAFPLGRIFGELPSVTIELDRIVPTTERVLPYFWIRGLAADDVERAVADATVVRSLTLIDDLGARGLLYRASWEDGADGLVTALVESPVTLLAAQGTAADWTFRLRVDDRDAIRTFRRACRERGIDVSLSRLRRLDRVDDPDADLTPPQLEALELAFDRGYYEDPRGATLAELAADLDISRQSLAGRLRRGHRNLLEELFDGIRRAPDATVDGASR